MLTRQSSNRKYYQMSLALRDYFLTSSRKRNFRPVITWKPLIPLYSTSMSAKVALHAQRRRHDRQHPSLRALLLAPALARRAALAAPARRPPAAAPRRRRARAPALAPAPAPA